MGRAAFDITTIFVQAEGGLRLVRSCLRVYAHIRESFPVWMVLHTVIGALISDDTLAFEACFFSTKLTTHSLIPLFFIFLCFLICFIDLLVHAPSHILETTDHILDKVSEVETDSLISPGLQEVSTLGSGSLSSHSLLRHHNLSLRSLRKLRYHKLLILRCWCKLPGGHDCGLG